MSDASDMATVGVFVSIGTYLAKAGLDRLVSKSDATETEKEKKRDETLTAMAKDMAEVKSDLRSLTEHKTKNAEDITALRESMAAQRADLDKITIRVTLLEASSKKARR